MAGCCYLESASWLNDYVDSMATFANGAHDDDVDATTQALNYMVSRGSEDGIIEYYRRLVEQQHAAAQLNRGRMRAPLDSASVRVLCICVSTARVCA
jgi:hypothetical protein